jgi:hypothetical protein
MSDSPTIALDAQFSSDFDDPRTVAANAAMVAQGVSTVESAPADYFSTDEVLRVMLPDGVSYIEHQVLSEGKRRAYLKQTHSDVKFEKSSGAAIMKLNPGEDKMALLGVAIVGWNLTRGGQPFPFTEGNKRVLLEGFKPEIIDLIDKEIRKANPWLAGDVTVEDLDAEIEQLQEQRKKLLEDEQGKGDSSTR